MSQKRQSSSPEWKVCFGLQADALEHALMAALPLGPQSAAGGVTLPESFRGELQVRLIALWAGEMPPGNPCSGSICTCDLGPGQRS